MELTQDSRKGKPCTKSCHRSYKSSPQRFAEHTRFIGYQYGLGNEAPIMLGTCIHCGSTLSRNLSSREIAVLEGGKGGRS